MNGFYTFVRGIIVTALSILLLMFALGAVFVILGATGWSEVWLWLRTTALILLLLGSVSIVIGYLTTLLKK